MLDRHGSVSFVKPKSRELGERISGQTQSF
jgi:hypothetical protein